MLGFTEGPPPHASLLQIYAAPEAPSDAWSLWITFREVIAERQELYFGK